MRVGVIAAVIAMSVLTTLISSIDCDSILLWPL
jgi:hypothetical protein